MGTGNLRLTDVGSVGPIEAQEKQTAKVPVGKILKLYIFPLGIVIGFSLIWIYLVFPKITEIFDQVDQSVLLAEQITAENEKLSALYLLSSKSTKITTDLDLINKVAPVETTQVVEFQQNIIQMAERNNLLVVEAFTQNRELVVESEQSEVLGIIEIPSEFTMRGDFTNIKAFIQAINDLKDFVIIGEMTLSSAADLESENLGNLYNGSWVLGITLVKYQFQTPNEANQLDDAYSRVPATVIIDEDVMNFV
jgi:Tfp pilus assembly protein PilO